MAGKSIKKIEINHLVCVDEGCMSKSSFNEEYMHHSYPSELMQNILLARPIYDSQNLLKTQNGFTQYIENEDVVIKYKVDNKIIFFKDIKNKIILKFKEM